MSIYLLITGSMAYPILTTYLARQTELEDGIYCGSNLEHARRIFLSGAQRSLREARCYCWVWINMQQGATMRCWWWCQLRSIKKLSQCINFGDLGCSMIYTSECVNRVWFMSSQKWYAWLQVNRGSLFYSKYGFWRPSRNDILISGYLNYQWHPNFLDRVPLGLWDGRAVFKSSWLKVSAPPHCAPVYMLIHRTYS